MDNIEKREYKWKLLSEEANRLCGNGDEVVSAMKKLYSVYSTDMLVWLGSLFDGRIGGFYYSASAKNGEGYLPDVESTYQAIVLLERCGVIDSYDCIPENIRRKIAGFICSLEDPDTGYFYHPQWSKSLVDEKVSRKGRDLAMATTLSFLLDFKLPYPDAGARLKESAAEKALCSLNIFSSEQSFREYLDGFDSSKNRVTFIHKLVSQANQISAAGLSDVALEFFDKVQDTLCAGQMTEEEIYPFYGISCLYRALFKTKMKWGKKVAEATISRYFNPGTPFSSNVVYELRNVWGIIDNIIYNFEEYGDEEDKKYAKELSLRILRLAPQIVSDTADSIAKYKKPTGAFSLSVDTSPTTSQGVPVAPPNTSGGDVNATLISVGMLFSIYKVLGLSDFRINLFEPSDFAKFVCTVDSNS